MIIFNILKLDSHKNAEVIYSDYIQVFHNVNYKILVKIKKKLTSEGKYLKVTSNNTAKR